MNNKIPFDISKFSLGLISATIIVLLLKTLKSIFIPLTFALLLTFLFAPLHRFLSKKKIPPTFTIFLTVILIFLGFTIVGIIVYSGASSFVTEFPKYEKQMVSLFQDVLFKLNLPQAGVKEYISKIDLNIILQKLSISSVISTTMGTFVDFLVKLLLTIIFMLFIIAGKEDFIDKFNSNSSQHYFSQPDVIYQKIESQVNKYLRNKTLLSLLTAVLSMIIIGILRIDFVIFSGLLIFILNFIPNFGSIIATLFPITICFLEYRFGWQLLTATITLSSLQFLIGNVIEPKVQGNKLNLSPLIILISLIFWAWIWGPVGMVLAVPLTSAIKIILNEFESLKVISLLMSEK